jgi:hypothetical protein
MLLHLTTMLSLKCKIRYYVTEAIECTMKYAQIPYVTSDCCDEDVLIVPRCSEWNESHEDVFVRGVDSMFICVSRMAHTFPSDPVSAGVVHSSLEAVKQLYMSELSDILSDGRTWICSSVDMSSCADVYLHCRLQNADVSRYPVVKEYLERHPFE